MAAFAALTFNIEVRAGLARLLDPPNVLSSCPDLARFSRRSSGTKLCADAAKLKLQTCGADNFRNWTSAAIVFVWPCARRRAESHKDMIPRWPELACGLRSSACS